MSRLGVDSELHIEEHLRSILRSFEPAKRKFMMRKIAAILRKENQKRITRQQDPDGKAWAPRKRKQVQRKQNGIKQKKKMMQGLKKAQSFKIVARLDEAQIGWTGKLGQIAYEHQHGEKVKSVQLPERQLLGSHPDDMKLIERIVLDAIEL